MRIVVLMSGGLDSAVTAALAQRDGFDLHPVFVDYGQRAAGRELSACKAVCARHGFGSPFVIRVPGYGRAIKSGLTATEVDLVADAFLPGRNLMLLVLAAAHAYQVDAAIVAMGLLSEETVIFPDQTHQFVVAAERAISQALGWSVRVITPLRGFRKADVVRLAGSLGIGGTYSCHSGDAVPCGTCIACREYQNDMAAGRQQMRR